jgi:hypothetical protein
MVLVSIVTPAFRAKSLPVVRAPVFIVMAVSATMFPTNVDPLPMVAELLTCHCTAQALAPLVKRTVEPDEVMSVLAIRKTQTALGLPWPLRVRVPDRFVGAAVTQ